MPRVSRLQMYIEPSLIRRLSIKLLDDEHGIRMEAWEFLYKLMEQSNENCSDIIAAASCIEGRVYLPEDHNLY